MIDEGIIWISPGMYTPPMAPRRLVTNDEQLPRDPYILGHIVIEVVCAPHLVEALFLTGLRYKPLS